MLPTLVTVRLPVNFPRPKFVLSQSHIKRDYKCGQTASPACGQTFVAKRQVHSRQGGQNKYFHYTSLSLW